MTDSGLVTGADGVMRCAWGDSTDDYRAYHDAEWGRAVRGDVALFERITLEAFQSGLSWLTILRKREGFRDAFARFDPDTVAAFGPGDVARLMADTGIVRNQRKVDATIMNAQALVQLRKGAGEGALDALVWSFAPAPRAGRVRSLREIAAQTAESTALSKELKRQGFVFVGPTTMYAAMQACGLVDDHVAGCSVIPRSGAG